MEIDSFLDLKTIVQIAVFMVGITQVLKNFFDLKSRRLKTFLTIFVGLAGGVLLHLVPAWIFTTLMGMSVGVVFYDYILKGLEKIFVRMDQ